MQNSRFRARFGKQLSICLAQSQRSAQAWSPDEAAISEGCRDAKILEATAGIEPAYTDLQSAA